MGLRSRPRIGRIKPTGKSLDAPESVNLRLHISANLYVAVYIVLKLGSCQRAVGVNEEVAKCFPQLELLTQARSSRHMGEGSGTDFAGHLLVLFSVPRIQP